MKQLKEGTPVWYDFNGEPLIGTILTVFKNLCYVTSANDSKLRTFDIDAVTPLTPKEYIDEFIIPAGWKTHYSNFYLEFTNSDSSTEVLIDKDVLGLYQVRVSSYECLSFLEYTKITTEISEAINEAITHCEKLNLLKQLETE